MCPISRMMTCVCVSVYTIRFPKYISTYSYSARYTGDSRRECSRSTVRTPVPPKPVTANACSCFSMSADPAAVAANVAVAANAAVAAATAAVQALSSHLPQSAYPQHKLALPSFWLDDPAGWFQHAEAEFTLARLPANCYICHVHVIHALPSEVLAAVRDLTRGVTAATPEPYLLLKEALLT